VYGRLDGKTGYMVETGRDLGGIEPVEYCDSLFLDACDIGRGSVVRRAGGDVIKGGREERFEFEVGDETAGGDVAGEEVCDIVAVIALTIGAKHPNYAQWCSLLVGSAFFPE